MIADETSVRSPSRTEHGIFLRIWTFFWRNQTAFVVGEPLCDLSQCRNTLLSPNIFTEGHFIKIQWPVVDEKSVESPDRTDG